MVTNLKYLAQVNLSMRLLGANMPAIGAVDFAREPELTATLWHCHQCAALIGIYSAAIIGLAVCPICCDVTLEPRGSFETILGLARLECSTGSTVGS